jgi:hypothetical protein
MKKKISDVLSISSKKSEWDLIESLKQDATKPVCKAGLEQNVPTSVAEHKRIALDDPLAH